MRVLIVFIITAVYAVCFTAIKEGLAFAPPLLFGGLRAFIGGVSLLFLVLVFRRPFFPERRHWTWTVVLGFITTTFGFGAMFLSPEMTGAGIASVLGNTQPLVVIILAAIFLKERITRGKTIALTFGLVGIAFISYPALTGGGVFGFSGGMLALAASGGASIGSLIIKRLNAGQSLMAVTAWQLIIGSIPLFLISAAMERQTKVIWNTEFVGLLLFLSLVGTSFTNYFWYWLVEREDVGRLSLFLFLVPIFGLGMAALVLGEKVTLLEIIGVIFTVAGIGAVISESWRIKQERD